MKTYSWNNTKNREQYTYELQPPLKMPFYSDKNHNYQRKQLYNEQYLANIKGSPHHQ
jgi:hypothetical protein